MPCGLGLPVFTGMGGGWGWNLKLEDGGEVA